MREMDTDFLIDEFLTSPGVEGESFDAKSKGILNNSDGRRKVVKHATAFANSGGGVMIIGADDDRNLIQDFDSTDESKSDLSKIAQQRTSPKISWDITSERYTGDRESDQGKRILRIDIEPAEEGYEEELISFRSNGDWERYHRVDDNTIKMNQSAIANFYSRLTEKHKNELLDNPLQLTREEDLPFYATESKTISGNHHPSDSRVTSLCKYHSTAIPYSGTLDFFDKGTMYELPTSITIYNLDGLKTLIGELAKRLDGDLEEGFGYVIKERDYQWSGKEVENFLTDCGSVHTVSEQVKGNIEEQEGVELEPPSTPYVIFCLETDFGPFWLEVRAERWDKNQPETDFLPGFCGLLLSDLPFYTEPVKDFYEAIAKSSDILLRDGIPNHYRQKITLQKIKFQGDQSTSLENVYVLDYPTETNQPRYVFIDNPFYDREPTLEEHIDQPVPSPFARGICSFDKIPLFVSGVPRNIDMDNLVLNFVEFTSIGYLDSATDLFLVNGVCRSPPS